MKTLIYVLSISIAVTLFLAQPPKTVAIDYSGPTDDWTAYGKGPGGGRHSLATQITPENVHHLEPAWVYKQPDYREKGEYTGTLFEGVEVPLPPSGSQLTPILFEDTLYICTSYNRVIALDPSTGEERWSYNPSIDPGGDYLQNCRGVSAWKSEDGGSDACTSRILTGTLDGRLIALDAQTGELCSDFGEGGVIDVTSGLSAHSAIEYSITTPPAIIGNTLITGAMVLDNIRTDVPSGVVRAYDVRSGALLWAWDSTPPGRPARVSEEGQRYEAGTANVWSMISVDPERGLVYLPTGNTSADHYGGHREEGIDDYSSSVVALDARTGEYVWHFQTVHHDVWDYDVPSQPTLYEVERDDQIIPALAQPTKMAHIFLLNRETGQPLFPVEERPVPTDGVPGEKLAPTQPFPTKPPPLHRNSLQDAELYRLHPWDTSCEDAYAKLRDDGIFTPPTLEGSLLYPSAIGGHNWGSPAIDSTRQTLVLNMADIPMVLTLYPRDQCDAVAATGKRIERQEGTPYCLVRDRLVSSSGVPCSGFPLAYLQAVDLKSGELKWQKPFGTLEDTLPVIGRYFVGTPTPAGPMTTDSGLIFIGASWDHYLRAFDTETGEELWKGRLPAAGIAVPMSYRVDKDSKQYVVISAGGHWAVPSETGAHLVAFALPDEKKPSELNYLQRFHRWLHSLFR